MFNGEVADHPGVSDLVLRTRGVGEGADVGAEQRLSLRGRPHPLVHVVEDDSVFAERLHNVCRLDRAFPFHSRVVVKEVVTHFSCRNILGKGGGASKTQHQVEKV